MTLKANANPQSTANSSHSERNIAGRSKPAVPKLRRAPRLPGHFPAEAMVIPYIGDVNLNLMTLCGDLSKGTPSDSSNPTTLSLAGAGSAESEGLGAAGFAAAYDDEDDEDADDLDELDEDDDEELDDEEDEELEDDLDDEDDDLDDDDLDEDEEEDDEDEDDEDE